MRRAGSLLIATLLALMVIYLGGGTMVMKCLHRDTVAVGVFTDNCCHEKKGKDKGQCMKVSVWKLQPSVESKQMTDTQEMCSVPIVLFGILGVSFYLLAKAVPFYRRILNPPHAPPRHYLAFIQVLII